MNLLGETIIALLRTLDSVIDVGQQIDVGPGKKCANLCWTHPPPPKKNLKISKPIEKNPKLINIGPTSIPESTVVRVS